MTLSETLAMRFNPPMTTRPTTIATRSDPITVAKENFYDRLPFTYRQVDIFCKVLIGVLIAIFVYYAVLK